MKKKKKKLAKPPSIRTEKIYERRSLACGKNNPMAFSCLTSPKAS